MKKNDSKFKKVLNAGDILVIAFGAMIGWGWVVSSGDWIQSGGILGTIIGFIISGIMIYFVGLTYAELTTAMPKCGGEHVFSYEAFGPIGSYICTWMLILSYIGVVCYEACSLPTVIQYIFPGFLKGYLYTIAGFDIYFSWVALGVCVSIIIVIINIIGTKTAAILQTILTIIIALVGLILVAGAAVNGEVSNIETQLFVSGDYSTRIFGILKIAMITPFFFFGFDVIPQAAEEVKIPLKKVGKFMLLSIILAVLFYILIVFSVGMVMNKSEIQYSINTTGLVTAEAMEKAFNSKLMAKVLIIGGICGIATSWNSFLIGGSRAIYSMANSNMIPGKFAVLHKKYKTPVNALILTGIFSSIAPFFGRAMLIWIVNAANFACCLAYCIVAFSFIVLRSKAKDMQRPYKIKHYKFVGTVAAIMSGGMALMYMIPFTGFTLKWQEYIIVLIWVILGLAFAIYSKCKYKEKFAMKISDFQSKE